MLYLIQPNGFMGKADITMGRAIVRHRVEEKSLLGLDWEPLEATDGVKFADLLEVALRFGVPVETGIIVDAGIYATWMEPARMDAVEADRQELLEALDSVARPASTDPGYAEHASELNRFAREAALDAEERYKYAVIARDELAESSTEERQDELAEHWYDIMAGLLTALQDQ